MSTPAIASKNIQPVAQTTSFFAKNKVAIIAAAVFITVCCTTGLIILMHSNSQPVPPPPNDQDPISKTAKIAAQLGKPLNRETCDIDLQNIDPQKKARLQAYCLLLNPKIASSITVTFDNAHDEWTASDKSKEFTLNNDTVKAIYLLLQKTPTILEQIEEIRKPVQDILTTTGLTYQDLANFSIIGTLLARPKFINLCDDQKVQERANFFLKYRKELDDLASEIKNHNIDSDLPFHQRINNILEALGKVAENNPEKLKVLDKAAKELEIDDLLPQIFNYANSLRKLSALSDEQIQNLIALEPKLPELLFSSNIFNTSDFAFLIDLFMPIELSKKADEAAISAEVDAGEFHAEESIEIQSAITQFRSSLMPHLASAPLPRSVEALQEVILKLLGVEFDEKYKDIHHSIFSKFPQVIYKCINDERILAPLHMILNQAQINSEDISALLPLEKFMIALAPHLKNPETLETTIENHKPALAELVRDICAQADEIKGPQTSPSSTQTDIQLGINAFIHLATDQPEKLGVINTICEELSLPPIPAIGLARFINKLFSIKKDQLFQLTSSFAFVLEIILESNIYSTKEIFDFCKLFDEDSKAEDSDPEEVEFFKRAEEDF